jgi:GTPase SAR1 family protein
LKSNDCKEANLSKKNIGDVEVKRLVEYLKENKVLIIMILFGNNIGAQGGVSLGDALKLNSSLTTLDISNNMIQDEGCISLAHALKVNSTLKILDLRSNKIGDQGGVHLGDALKVNSNLNYLNLSYNDIGNKGGATIGDSLKFNDTLKTLDLKGNNIGNEAAAIINDALKVNSSLFELEIDDNNIQQISIRSDITSSILRNKASPFSITITTTDFNSVSIPLLSDSEIANKRDLSRYKGIHCVNLSLSQLHSVFLSYNNSSTKACICLRIENTPFSYGVFPDFLVKNSICKMITSLSIIGCGLKSANNINSSFPNLQYLNLNNNPELDLKTFVPNKTLKNLQLCSCKLKILPELESESLETLNISGNPVASIPLLPFSLKLLHAYSCPFFDLIPNEMKQNMASLIQYCIDLVKSEQVYKSKLLVLGSGGIGKTTLVDALAPLKEELSIKIGTGIMSKFNKRECIIQNGQFSYYSLSKHEEKLHIPLKNCTITNIDEKLHSFQINPANNINNNNDDKSNNKEIIFIKCPSIESMTTWITVIKRQSRNEATDTVDIRSWRINKEELIKNEVKRDDLPYIDASIWDFAGQETYREGHQFFLGHRSVYLVLLDLNPIHKNDTTGDVGRVGALNELREWLVSLHSRIGNNNEDGHIIIVGNKLDLLNTYNKNDTMSKRRIAVAEVARKAGLDGSSWQYIEVSSKTNENVDYLRKQIITAMSEQTHMGELVPLAYHKVKSYLLEEKVKKEKEFSPPVISSQSVVICLGYEPRIIYRLLSLLNNWSECVFFGTTYSNEDDNTNVESGLSQTVFLDPQWLTKQVIGSLLFYLGGTVGELSNNEQKVVLLEMKCMICVKLSIN